MRGVYDHSKYPQCGYQKGHKPWNKGNKEKMWKGRNPIIPIRLKTHNKKTINKRSRTA
jgi:hypothetical protein